MKNFFLIVNNDKDPELEYTLKLKEKIESAGGSVQYSVLNKATWGISNQLKEIDADCIISLGGDGTFVRIARDFAKFNIPILGVNIGNLGYLCEVERDNVFDAIDLLINDNYNIEYRMLIQGGAEDSNIKFIALNDIVLHSSVAVKMIDYELKVNGQTLAEYSADGLIISTPTGSTGYNMSCGGPIVDPNAQMMVITPICPHNSNARSICVGSEAEIYVKLLDKRIERKTDAYVHFDGDNRLTMHVDEAFTVSASPLKVAVIKINELSFLQNLAKKMG